MAARKSLTEEMADRKYKKHLKEKDQYLSLDDYCAKRGIE